MLYGLWDFIALVLSFRVEEDGETSPDPEGEGEEEEEEEEGKAGRRALAHGGGGGGEHGSHRLRVIHVAMQRNN